VQINTASVIFDLGGVVLRWSPDSILRDFSTHEATRSIVRQEIFKHPDWLDMDRGVLAEDKAIERFQKRTRFSLNPRNTTFVDDHLPNIESAGRLGFKTLLFSDPVQCRSELHEILGDLF
jgi:FMN phosphatase YigB (HAD superfamily)